MNNSTSTSNSIAANMTLSLSTFDGSLKPLLQFVKDSISQTRFFLYDLDPSQFFCAPDWIQSLRDQLKGIEELETNSQANEALVTYTMLCHKIGTQMGGYTLKRLLGDFYASFSDTEGIDTWRNTLMDIGNNLLQEIKGQEAELNDIPQTEIKENLDSLIKKHKGKHIYSVLTVLKKEINKWQYPILLSLNGRIKQVNDTILEQTGMFKHKAISHDLEFFEEFFGQDLISFEIGEEALIKNFKEESRKMIA